MKNQKSLDGKTVKHVADLAKLGLTDQEVLKFQSQLSGILDLVNRLSEIDTNGVEPTSQVTGLENVFREDETECSFTQEEALANAPSSYKGFFKVRPVLEE